jgi:putative SOS response-associated peptidase YedK
MHWGLIPSWAKDAKMAGRLINARGETVADKPSFRSAFKRRRCLIPADGFYEWETLEHGRTPHWVYRADGHPMAFAGIWASRLDPGTDTWNRTCSIITTSAEGAVSSIHDRMPVSLPLSRWDPWLDRELRDPEAVAGLLEPIDPDLLMEHAVSSRVNSVRNNGPELREKVEPETLF